VWQKTYTDRRVNDAGEYIVTTRPGEYAVYIDSSSWGSPTTGGNFAIMLLGADAAVTPVDCSDAYKTQSSCDGDDGCAWCTCGAVPPACNTIADARTLPPAVFTCDKVLEEEQQL
jgi:hypothetical protein